MSFKNVIRTAAVAGVMGAALLVTQTPSKAGKPFNATCADAALAKRQARIQQCHDDYGPNGVNPTSGLLQQCVDMAQQDYQNILLYDCGK